MAYVRKVRTASGAVAVQVARKDHGKVVVLAHLGSAHTDAELGILLDQAQQMVLDGQAALDFEVSARAQSMADVADFRERALVAAPAKRRDLAPVVASGRTLGTSSRLLYDLLAHVYDWLGFGEVGDEVFRDLVIARIVEPTSKIDALRVLADLGAALVSYKTLDRHVRNIHASPARDVVAAKCFEHSRDCGGLSLLLYDTTTLHFQAEHEDELRRVGYSKDRRIDPQIVVGLLVDRTGMPLEIGCFEGNTAETTTIVPIIRGFVERHQLQDIPMVVAADAGMLSAANLKALDELELSFIVGSRMTKAPGDLESHFHWNGDVFTDGQIIDTVTPRHGNNKVNDCNKRAEPVWDPEAHPRAWRAVWAYSAKRARRDQKTLAAQEARARAIVEGSKQAKTARFVKIRGDDRTIDESSLARAQSLAGLKGYVTNVPVTVMPAAEVIAKYHNLWHVEKAFRMSKSDLKARPMFNRMRDAIEAHLTIVFAALAISHVIQSRTGVSIAKVIKALRPLRSATININGATQTFPAAIPHAERKILTDLGFKPGY
ncbi:IS1634 family transposase [Mycobacterium riyadhense]|uniref:IS1634 family transposase n=1 Tax=Mycobacterium riyadhense TaxID=486698 RepID=UPI00195A93B4|nr:IS1634 family transposase [Mycobacterium riyadhense]